MSDGIPQTVQLGFLTVFSEGAGTLGGYLVTNGWGRPLDFRLSTAVQPNQVQRILYGPTLQEFLRNDLIGKTLIDKASTPVHLLFVDSVDLLPLTSRVEQPVLAILRADDAPILGETQTTVSIGGQTLVYDSRKHATEFVNALLEKVDRGLDPTEPFQRIREAMTEARKLGANTRAA